MAEPLNIDSIISRLLEGMLCCDVCFFFFHFLLFLLTISEPIIRSNKNLSFDVF